MIKKKMVFNVMFSKRTGGIEQSFLDYNEALSQNYKVVSLVNSQCKIMQEIKGEYHTVRQFNKYDFLAAFRIRKLIKKHKPAVLIAHSTRAYMLCKLAITKVPIITVSHNFKFKHILSSRFIIAITEAMQNKLKNASMAKVYEVPNMISIEGFEAQPTKINTPLKLGFIGTLTHNKGADILIDAVYKLKVQGTEVNLIIAGDGEEKKSLIKMVDSKDLNEKVKFLGWLPNSKKEKFYDDIDVLCVPSRQETFGIVFLEAMKYGVPIITSRTSGANYVVKGIAKFFDDTEGLEKAIIEIINEPSKVKDMVSAGNVALQKYSLENVSKKLHTVVEEVLGQ